MDSKPLRILQTHEIRSLPWACGDQCDVVLNLSLTGIRFGELVRPDLADVDLNAQSYRVVRQPKSQTRDRSVPFPVGLLKTLQLRIAGREAEDHATSAPSSGVRLKLANWKRVARWKESPESIGRPYRRVHDLRHSFVAQSIVAGIGTWQIHQVMGIAARPVEFRCYTDRRETD